MKSKIRSFLHLAHPVAHLKTYIKHHYMKALKKQIGYKVVSLTIFRVLLKLRVADKIS